MNAHSSQHRIGIGAGFFAVTLGVCALILAATAGCSPAQRYRAQQDAKSLFAVLHNQLKSGDSLARVQELLGPGTQPAARDRLLGAARRFAQRFPQDYAAGVRDDDLFVEYSTEGNLTVALQFRDGRLINFNPRNYEQVPELSVVAAGDLVQD